MHTTPWLKRLTMLALLGAAAGAAAQDSSSPYDTNPKCTERTTDTSSPDCVVPQDGQPRHYYAPQRKIPPKPPAQKPAAPVPGSTSREGARQGTPAH